MTCEEHGRTTVSWEANGRTVLLECPFCEAERTIWSLNRNLRRIYSWIEEQGHDIRALKDKIPMEQG